MALDLSDNPYLDTALKPLRPIFNRKDLMEIVANQPGEVLLEIAGQGWDKVSAPDLTKDYWQRLCHVLAGYAGLEFGENNSTLSVQLPGGHRFQALVGKATTTEVSVSIRIQRQTKTSLEDFDLNQDQIKLITDAVKEEANILISGGTSTGKTTFLNLLLPHIPSDKRIITIEDTRELIVPHHNKMHMLVSRNKGVDKTLTYQDAFDHAMRSRPDRILLGEISIMNAFPALLLLNSGHKGFFCTIHADSASLALEKGFYQRVALAGHNEVDQHDLADYLRETLDLVIQIKKVNNKRKITEIWFPQKGKPKKLLQS